MRQFLRVMVVLMTAITAWQAQACTAIARPYRHDWYSARTFDWSDGRIMMVFNRSGAQHRARGLELGVRPLHWRARYNSMTLDMDNDGKPNTAAVVDGMNQMGLSVAVLELDKAQYPAVMKSRPAIGSSQLAQYWLDRYATVGQVLATLPSLAVTASVYQGQRVPLHYVLDDAGGDHAVVEYLDGRLKIYHGHSCPLDDLTNTDYGSALQQWRQHKHGMLHHQGVSGYSSMARFLRVAYFLRDAVPPSTQKNQVSMLWAGLSLAREPSQSPWPTQWSVVRNNTMKQYCFRSHGFQESRCYELRQVNFSQTAVSFKRLA